MSDTPTLTLVEGSPSSDIYPTSIRFPEKLLSWFDEESRRLGWSRNRTVLHYLVEGVKKGERPQALSDILRAATT